MHACARTRTHTHAHTHIHSRAHTHARTHAHTHTHAHTRTRTCTHNPKHPTNTSYHPWYWFPVTTAWGCQSMSEQPRKKAGNSNLVEERKKEERTLNPTQGVTILLAQMQFWHHCWLASKWSPMDPDKPDLEVFAANTPFHLCSAFWFALLLPHWVFFSGVNII